MKIDWKTLSLAIITAIIVTAIFGLILSTVIYPEIPWEEIFQSSPGTVTFAEGTGLNVHFLPLWVLIVGNLILIAVLTALFYFLISYVNKRREKKE